MVQHRSSLQTKFITDQKGPVRNLGTYSNVINDRRLYDILFNTSEMNFVDKAAYPDVADMEQQTVRFLLELTNGTEQGVGFATTGSSEAIVLALAWHRKSFLLHHPDKKHQPLNFLINEGYHKAFDKFSSLFNAELRKVPLNNDLKVDVKEAAKLIDDNTFCIVGIAGSTEIGMVDDIEGLNKLALAHHIPIHVDAAIGGYVLPFIEQVPSAWDFSLSAVKTINISAHKYGLCLPGIGFLLVRDASVIPEDYNGDIAYLAGGVVSDNALTCSRNAAFVINAHYNMCTYGIDGYSAITMQNYDNASYFAKQLRQIDHVNLVLLGDVPVVLFSSLNAKALSMHLSDQGWIQSAHHIGAINKACIRVVVRKHMTRAVIDELLTSIHAFRPNPVPKPILSRV